MSTPWFELPEHLKMGVTEAGLGPVCEGEPEFHHWACWCGDPQCPEAL